MLPVPVPRERTGLAHQRADDVAVVYPGLAGAVHSIHTLDEAALVVDLQVVGVLADLYLHADQPGRHSVRVVGYPNRAPPAHLRLVDNVLRHRGGRQWSKAAPLMLHLRHDQPVALVRHLPDEREIYIHRPEVPAASQYQRLAYRVLEPVMTLLGHAVLVG